MDPTNALNGPGKPPEEARLLLRLYIAGRAPNSVLALANLNAICREFFPAPREFKMEIIDVLEDPRRAIEDDVLATPTLVKLWPPPIQKIIGNLSEKEKLLDFLGLRNGLA